MREFRAAWIATYANIDWPSKPGLPVEQQKAELRGIVEKAAELRLNALIFQVRPACDALYQSSLEPWSWFLTGEMGKGPEAGFDPLKFVIELCHARGVELHAWFNPYRAGLLGSKFSSRHITKTQPRVVRKYGKYYWLDPAEQFTQDQTVRVILDVVKRYDIDGVHLDDYFYPYPEKDRNGEIISFPDDSSWARYRKEGGRRSREDWRRENVNRLVRRLRSEIHHVKSWVTFGISPFGIWRPGNPPQIKGLDAFDLLYADARCWLTNGWVDYLAPQLYWTIDRPETSYSALYAWWRQQDQKGVPIWPGGSVTHLVDAERWPPQEIFRQIELTRKSPSPGYIHWNVSALESSSPSFQQGLRDRLYSELALVPPNPGDIGDVLKPTVTLATDSSAKYLLSWTVPARQQVASWILQVKKGDVWHTQVLPAAQREISLSSAGIRAVAVSCLSRHRNQSPVALKTF